jgi:hypothetical protein
MCIAEAVSYRVLACLGLRVADAFAVGIGAEFAANLTAQFEIDPPVVPGRHWGTRLISDAIETTIEPDVYEDLRSPADIFMIYLGDVICAYRDRQTHGNVLLVPAVGGRSLDVLPIDQSDCFGGPDCICTPHLLDGARNQSYAQAFAGMENLVLDGGPALVEGARAKLMAAKSCILESVSFPPDAWYDRAGTDPGKIHDFLEYRIDNLDTLARLDHWRGMSRFGRGGDYVLL